jgi:ribosome-associated protein
VNKVATKAQLRVRERAIRGLSEAARQRLRRLAGRRLTEDGRLLVQSDAHRSQQDNRAACLERLRDLVGRAAREPKRRKKTKPSRAAKQKRLDEKKRRGEVKRGRRATE